MNAKMPELRCCFEAAGFTNVKTVLSSGNVVFDASPSTEAALEQSAESAMQDSIGRTFSSFVRSVASLHTLLENDPYAAFTVPPNAKRVVTFLHKPNTTTLALPIKFGDAQILSVVGREIFTVYEPGEKGPEFMRLIEKTFGSDVTTRTWDTVKKCAGALG